MNAPRMASLVAALAVTTSACSGYVADTSIAPGDRVRVTAPSMDLDKGVGTVAALETETLVVSIEERADALEVPLAVVRKLEVHRGQKRKTVTGATIGGLSTLAVGGVLMALWCSTEECDATGQAVWLLFSALPGAGIGALIGLAIQTDRWENVPLDDIRVGLLPGTPHAVAVSGTLRLR